MLVDNLLLTNRILINANAVDDGGSDKGNVDI